MLYLQCVLASIADMAFLVIFLRNSDRSLYQRYKDSKLAYFFVSFGIFAVLAVLAILVCGLLSEEVVELILRGIFQLGLILTILVLFIINF